MISVFWIFYIYGRSKHFVKCIFLHSLTSSIQRCINHWENKFAQILNFLHLTIYTETWCEDPLYSRNKQTSNTKEECVHITTQTHKNNTIYICRFQRLLSCIHRVPTHPLLLKIRYEQPKMWEEGRQTWEKEKDMWEECEWKETYIREKRMYHGQWPWHLPPSSKQLTYIRKQKWKKTNVTLEKNINAMKRKVVSRNMYVQGISCTVKSSSNGME
jgi:hypothetical protein